MNNTATSFGSQFRNRGNKNLDLFRTSTNMTKVRNQKYKIRDKANHSFFSTGQISMLQQNQQSSR